MVDTLDLAGASGAFYRFRLVDPGQPLPATAGNFVYVSRPQSERVVVCCGAANRLTEANVMWPSAERQHLAEAIYIRLNVSRETRQREYHDLVERHRPPMLAPELER